MQESLKSSGMIKKKKTETMQFRKVLPFIEKRKKKFF